MKRRLQLQKFLWELANTGAHLRAMKALLPSLKEIYHYSELQRPFIVPRISIRPAVASNKLLAAAMGARARRDMNHLYGDVDLYEDLDPEVATKLRDNDAALAELAGDFENGELAREILADDGPPVTDEGWEAMQEAYNGGVVPVEVTVIEAEPAKRQPVRRNGKPSRWQNFLADNEITEEDALEALGQPSVDTWMRANPGKTERDAHEEILRKLDGN